MFYLLYETCLSDINECNAETDNCDVNAKCTNTEGSFTCTCNKGYTGDGETCTGMLFVLRNHYMCMDQIQHSMCFVCHVGNDFVDFIKNKDVLCVHNLFILIVTCTW